MVDQLTPSQRPPQSTETLTSPQRLEALLATGAPRTAVVVQSSPQLLLAQNPALSSPSVSTTPVAASTAATLAATVATTTANTTATTPAITNTTSTTIGVATTSTVTPAGPPVTQAEVYKIQIRLEGRLYELLTSKPLDLGSSIQLSRGGDNRISIQALPTPATTSQQPQQPQLPATAALAKPAANNPVIQTASSRAETPTAATYTPATLNTRFTAQPTPQVVTTENVSNQPSSKPVTAPVASNPVIQTAPSRGETPTAATYTPATLNTRFTAQPTPQVVTTENVSNQPSSKPVSANSAIERVAIAPLKSELTTRIGPGERLNADVISSRPLLAPASPLTSTQVQQQTQHQTPPAVVIKTETGNHQIRIDLQTGHKIEFVSPRPLPPGTQIQIVRDTQGQLWAELPTVKTRAIEQALREHLPQQQSPAALLNLLSAAQISGQLQPAKPLLFSLFQILLGRSITSPLQTDAASVKQQVQNSGTLLESKLAQNNTQNINHDHKAILLKVTQNLNAASNQRELPAALSERINTLTQQALSRVLVNQITSLGTQTQDAGNEQNRTLALDIPIAWQDKTENLQLKIRREERGKDEETEAMLYRWQVRLNFEVDENRILEAELTLESDQISIIWSGDAELRQRLEAQLDQLQQRLESIGLKVKTLGVRELLPETGNRPSPPRNQLIDIKT